MATQPEAREKVRAVERATLDIRLARGETAHAVAHKRRVEHLGEARELLLREAPRALAGGGRVGERMREGVRGCVAE